MASLIGFSLNRHEDTQAVIATLMRRLSKYDRNLMPWDIAFLEFGAGSPKNDDAILTETTHLGCQSISHGRFHITFHKVTMVNQLLDPCRAHHVDILSTKELGCTGHSGRWLVNRLWPYS